MFDAEKLLLYTNGYWHNASSEIMVCGIETDTRKELAGKLFVALRGEKFDAHDFLDTAYQKGAVLCVNQNKVSSIPAGATALVVSDTLEAYQNIAANHRLEMDALRLFSVTGSVGKTSVKEMLKSILCEFAGENSVVATEGNTNNHIGVPQNLLRLTENCRFAVIEMGTSSPGEIAVLSKMAVPDVALVNSVAPCHLEKLIDLAGVAKEKGDIFKFLKSDGIAVLPCDIPETEILKASAGKHKIITFGNVDSGADVSARFIKGNLHGSTFELFINSKRIEISWRLTGRHQCRNAAAAAAAAMAIGIPEETIAAGLRNTTLPGMRGKLSMVNGCCILNDAYNASPASMEAVLKMFSEAGITGRKVLLLGTMLELGSNSVQEHQNILKLARELFPDGIIITVGNGFSGLSGADTHYSNSADAAAEILKLCVSDTTILVKGSRGTALELAIPPEAR